MANLPLHSSSAASQGITPEIEANFGRRSHSQRPAHHATTLMKNLTTRFLTLGLLAISFTATSTLADGHRMIVGHAQTRICDILTAGGGFGCITRSVPSVVDVYNEDLEFVTHVATDTDGYFVVSDLKPGTYVLIVSAVTPPVSAGRYSNAVQTVTLHKKQDTLVDLFLWFQPD